MADKKKNVADEEVKVPIVTGEFQEPIVEEAFEDGFEAGDFEIGEEVSGTRFGSFHPPIKDTNGQYDFPKAYLVDVSVKEVEIKKGDKIGQKANILNFTFADAPTLEKAKVRFVHSEWQIDNVKSEDGAKMFDGMKNRIKHLFETFLPNSQVVLGTGARSFVGWFNIIENQFKTSKANNTPIYSNIPVYVFVTFQKKGGNVQFPLFPNFIELAVAGKKPITFTVNTKYHQITPKASAGAANMALDISPSDFPEMGNEFPS
jgi:hypothetical protein